MSTNRELQISASILSAVAAVKADMLGDVILTLARAGQLEALESIHVGSPEMPARWFDGHPAKLAFAFNVLPVLEAVKPAERARAERLCGEWLGWCKADTLDHMESYLETCLMHDVLEQIVPIGGAALDRSNVLSRRIEKEVRDGGNDTVLALVNASVAIRHYAPLAAALNAVLRSEKDSSAASILEGLLQIQVPPEVLAQFSKSVVSTVVGDRYSISRDTPDFRVVNTVSRWLGVMSMVDIDAEDWRLLANTWQALGRVLPALATQRALALESASTLGNMAKAGISMDDMRVDMEGKRDPTPIIHAAAKADNAKVVQALLEAGADPTVTIKFQGKARSAFDLAPPGSAAAAVLHTHRARQSMAAAIRKSDSAPSA
jgi:hypothetical protein